MGEWQPIETAPKDGTWIMVFGKRWDDSADDPPFGFTRWQVSKYEFWERTDKRTQKLVERDDSGWCTDCGMFPTHWMPLPSPPENVSPPA